MILITGVAGQLGSEVASELSRREIDCIGVDVGELDITDSSAARQYIRNLKPSCVIHCAAYTAVDKAEDEPELCMLINAGGTENIAQACREIDAEMIYISTDYVFRGEGDEPHETGAPKAPLQIYGKSKLEGEKALAKHLEKYCIIRTSWVFGRTGSNFAKTMLKLAQTRDVINVVNDQIGSPTYAPDLAALVCDLAASGKYGIYHATNEGFCSWAEFAAEIMRQSGSPCRIIPISTEQYPAKAARPKNSRLSKTSLDAAGLKRLPDWQNALGRFLSIDN